MKPENTGIYEKLAAYSQEDYAAFHMPGHKRQPGDGKSLPGGLPWNIDITEIDGFDNLHHAEGILRESMTAAASYYGVKRTLYSVNGSTAGIMSAVFSAAKPGDTILMGRNCHRSVYNAVQLRELSPVYLLPRMEQKAEFAGEISAEEVERKLNLHPEAKAVIVTSPTYEGIVSDIRAIADLVHSRGIPLIVDEAHGAHLRVVRDGSQADAVTDSQQDSESHNPAGKDNTVSARAEETQARLSPESDMQERCCREYFPLSAVCQGADLVIQSLHKTLPALTQTAVIHVNGDLVDPDEVSRFMSVFQTSSPSYVLMASIDSCIRYLSSDQGQKDWNQYSHRLADLRCSLSSDYRHIHLISPAGAEPSKLLLSADGMSGQRFYDILRTEYRIQPEMYNGRYVLLMTSLCDTDEMYDRLLSALREIDHISGDDLAPDCKAGKNSSTGQALSVCVEMKDPEQIMLPRQVFTPAQADRMNTETVPIEDSAGRVSAEYAYQYPPGIPLLVPGEEIEGNVLGRLLDGLAEGREIQGLASMDASQIRVLR